MKSYRPLVAAEREDQGSPGMNPLMGYLVLNG